MDRQEKDWKCRSISNDRGISQAGGLGKERAHPSVSVPLTDVCLCVYVCMCVCMCARALFRHLFTANLSHACRRLAEK